jgi:signal transduction histidine kinase
LQVASTFVGTPHFPAYSPPPRAPPRVQLGLRLQIVLALAGLMLLAFVPLFFAVASLTRATVLEAREHDAMARPRTAAVTAGDRATPLVRLVALYMTTFGLALLVFAYLVLTRLIVRPVDQLVDAADRVANGARTLPVPRSGARELIELGASVRAMAERLISEEAALLVKVDELTQTTTRLTETQAQLVRSERMASVGRLAAGVAHEIGNPLAALAGMQDLMLLDPELPPEAQRDFLERMRKETERIHTVVRDLLDFARPEGSGAQSEGSDAMGADVASVVGDVIALVRPQKPFRTVRIETDVPPSLRVKLPAHRLTQVLLNLVLNAGAAVASGPRGAGRVAIAGREADGRVRIDIEDDGPGIAPEVLDRLFEPFVTTKEVGEGTGLGLAVCRGIVESAGGEVGVAAVASGARFFVVLPSLAG